MTDPEIEPTAQYFGPPAGRKDYEVQVETPVGAICTLCEEAVGESDIGSITRGMGVAHYECTLRMAVGSVGHQLHQCSCYGGTAEDPEGMSRREAAIAAAQLFHRQGLITTSPSPN